MKHNGAFSEIIESSLHGFVAQCWQWNDFPSFGELITVQSSNRIIFGLVHQIQTGSMDPIRSPFPYKKTEEELLREQPQIFEFLKTTFSCLSVGYLEKGKVMYVLAPEPPKIHAFATHTNADMSKTFFAHLAYLHLLFGQSGQIFNLDELLLAIIRQQATLGIMNDNSLKKFIDLFSLLTGNEYRRLKIFLQRAEPLLQA